MISLPSKHFGWKQTGKGHKQVEIRYGTRKAMTKLSLWLSPNRSRDILLRPAAGLLTQSRQSHLQEAVKKKLVDTQSSTASAYDRSYVQSVAVAAAWLAKCVLQFCPCLRGMRAHPAASNPAVRSFLVIWASCHQQKPLYSPYNPSHLRTRPLL